MGDTSHRDRDRDFFNRFIAYDCADQNDGFDVETIQWFYPADMQIMLRRLWFFGGRAYGMDIAEELGPGKGARGGRWAVAAGASPRNSKDLDAWLALLARDNLRGCLVSISYSIPEAAIELFLGPAAPSAPTPPPRV